MLANHAGPQRTSLQDVDRIAGALRYLGVLEIAVNDRPHFGRRVGGQFAREGTEYRRCLGQPVRQAPFFMPIAVALTSSTAGKRWIPLAVRRRWVVRGSLQMPPAQGPDPCGVSVTVHPIGTNTGSPAVSITTRSPSRSSQVKYRQRIERRWLNRNRKPSQSQPKTSSGLADHTGASVPSGPVTSPRYTALPCRRARVILTC